MKITRELWPVSQLSTAMLMQKLLFPVVLTWISSLQINKVSFDVLIKISQIFCYDFWSPRIQMFQMTTRVYNSSHEQGTLSKAANGKLDRGDDKVSNREKLSMLMAFVRFCELWRLIEDVAETSWDFKSLPVAITWIDFSNKGMSSAFAEWIWRSCCHCYATQQTQNPIEKEDCNEIV